MTLARFLLIFLIALPVAQADEERHLFAVQVTIGPNWDAEKPTHEQAFFNEHSAHLKSLREAEIIVLGARYSDIGLLIFKATSVDEVRTLMDSDPSMQAGTFQYDVHPFNVFYPGAVP